MDGPKCKPFVKQSQRAIGLPVSDGDSFLMAATYRACVRHQDRDEVIQVGQMNSKNIRVCIAALAGAVMLGAPAFAGSLADQFSNCANKFSVSTAASVMLQCTAADGKLTNCKVLESANPNADKAALCVADAIPVGSKTGDIKVPIKFDPGK
jgi:hypothetical protein